jgi:hypothetical protein
MWVGGHMWSFPTQYYTGVNTCNNHSSNLRITEQVKFEDDDNNQYT